MNARLSARLIAAALLVPALALAEEPPRAPRDTWYVGFGLGTGNGLLQTLGNASLPFDGVSQTGATSELALNFKIGRRQSPTMLLGFDLTGVRSQQGGGWLGGRPYVLAANFDAMSTWFPYERGLFLRGGAGVSVLSFSTFSSFGHDSVTYVGANMTGGGGYAHWLDERVALTVNLDLSAQFYVGPPVAGAGNTVRNPGAIRVVASPGEALAVGDGLGASNPRNSLMWALSVGVEWH